MADRRATWYAATLSAIIISSVAAGIGKKEGTLKLVKLEVPQWANLRTSVTLNCLYELGSDSLYSVKWYKDEHEFYRYTPEMVQVFNMDGINVDVNKSSATSVTLFPLTRSSEGNYKCEVSSDAPNFPTVVEDANMTIIALPDDGSKIDGLRQFYSLGESVEANCTAKMAFPAAHVTWYINNVELDSYLLERYPVDQTEGPFYNSTVGVRFPLTKDWMESNKNKPMDVRCMAKVADTNVLINKTNFWLRPVPDHSLSQERHILNSGASSINRWTSLLMAFAFHFYEARHN